MLTSFVGRAGAVRDVAGLLGEYRLVTVTGPGGVGKTRLAGQVAGQVAGRFTDGAWLAELAAVRDPAQVAGAVAAALGIPEQPGVPAAEALARVLAGQQLLLVLDNCEHVIGAAAQLCARLLAACDDVRVLATSREPLAVAGEARYRLGPLTLPSPGDPDGAGCEAVALFADRARRADARFVLDGQAGPVVARLVVRLDGMPLAIELAAARVEALGVAQLLDRIEDRFALLTGGDRLAAGRQRSLAATVAWSYRLLTEPERRVFRAVAVFQGPFTLEGPRRSPGPAPDRSCCGWWTARCWSRRGPGRMAGPGTRCWKRCAPTGPGCWLRPARPTGWPRRWPGTRCGWPGRPRQGCGPSPGRRLGPAGWTPRTPPRGRRWPGPWSTTRRPRCGWPARWPGGGFCGADWPVSTGCSARPQAAPRRAAAGGAPRSSGSAGQRSSRSIWPHRWVISPRSGTPSRAGRRPGR